MFFIAAKITGAESVCATVCYFIVKDVSLKVPLIHYRKNQTGPIKKWSGPIVLTVYTGNNQVGLMIKKCTSTHTRNHRKARQAHMKMVRNEDAFTQGHPMTFFSGILNALKTLFRLSRIFLDL